MSLLAQKENLRPRGITVVLTGLLYDSVHPCLNLRHSCCIQSLLLRHKMAEFA